MDPVDFWVQVGRDGDSWCALVGENLQEGVAGFGATAAEALEALAEEMRATGLA